MMQAALLLRVLDLAFLGVSMWSKYDKQNREGAELAERIRGLREQLLLGEVSPEVAHAKLDGLIEQAQAARRASFGALPKPVHMLGGLDDD